jgi:hypothetical protein
MDVIVEGSITTNAMIITDQKIMFDDIPEYNYCQE